MTQEVTPTSTITLPTWTDPTSIAAFLTSIASLVIGYLTVVHPGWTPPSSDVQVAVSVLSLLIAGGAQIANLYRHTTVTKAAINAGASLAVPANKAKRIVSAPPAPVPNGTPSAAA